MGESFILRRGSIDSGLNLEVVSGSTFPENPKGNVIFVKTSTPVTKVVMSEDKKHIDSIPSQKGLVVIQTGVPNDLPMSISKKKNYEVRVYVNWVRVDQGSGLSVIDSWLWTDESKKWTVVGKGSYLLYDRGNQFSDITGGWAVTENVSLNKNNIGFYSTGGAFGSYTASTIRRVDITNLKKLVVSVRSFSVSDNSHAFFAINGPGIHNEKAITGNGDIIMDVSRYNGFVTVAVALVDDNEYAGGSLFQITKVELTV